MRLEGYYVLLVDKIHSSTEQSFCPSHMCEYKYLRAFKFILPWLWTPWSFSGVLFSHSVTHCSVSDYLLHIAEIQSSDTCIRNMLSICLCFSQSINIRVYENQHFEHLQSFTGTHNTSKKEVLWANLSDQPC